jgi:hypothetical protein
MLFTVVSPAFTQAPDHASRLNLDPTVLLGALTARDAISDEDRPHSHCRGRNQPLHWSGSTLEQSLMAAKPARCEE